MSSPANGTAFVALLVGGNEDILRNLRGELFDEFGIEIRNQWQNAREFCAMPPRGTEVILILTDFCAHSMSREAAKIAKAAKIRYALIGRKKSAWLNGLNTCGFIHKPSWLAPPPVVRKEPTKMEPKTAAAPATNGVAKAPPPIAPVIFNAAELQPLPRYIEPPRKWTEADMQAVVRLTEAWRATTPPGSLEADGDRYVRDVWRELGTFRTPAVLRLRIDALRTVIRVPAGLLIALSRCSRSMHLAKRAYVKAEASILKGPRSTWPEHVSAEAAYALIGVKARLAAVHTVFDCELGLYVYRRAEFLEVLEALETRGVTADFRGCGRTSLEWEQRILSILKTRGPSARGRFGITSADSNPRGVESVRALVTSGAILEADYRGTRWYRLPEHSWPPAPRPLPPKFLEKRAERLAAQARRPVPPPKPSGIKAAAAALADVVSPRPPVAPTDALRELRADVYRAMRAGEITAKDAADLLRNLASGG